MKSMKCSNLQLIVMILSVYEVASKCVEQVDDSTKESNNSKIVKVLNNSNKDADVLYRENHIQSSTNNYDQSSKLTTVDNVLSTAKSVLTTATERQLMKKCRLQWLP
ncbi:hypothetical protein FQA39_LY11936 [Lamprigera yunnana]|nr:hypothetical protein FQA39_LY11936 [Lamprigera yunnana]